MFHLRALLNLTSAFILFGPKLAVFTSLKIRMSPRNRKNFEEYWALWEHFCDDEEDCVVCQHIKRKGSNRPLEKKEVCVEVRVDESFQEVL